MKTHHYTPIQFPPGNAALAALANDAELEEYAGPLFTPHQPVAHDGPVTTDYDYVVTFPKLIIRAFVNKGAAESGYTDVRRYTGVVFFSDMTSGPPGW